jgi:hypothetical protein
MTTVMSGMLSPGCSSPAGMVIPARRSPALGELVVIVSWVSGREEDHVVAVAQRHELQAPKSDHRSQRKWTFRVSHLEERQENDVDTQRPYLARQLSVLGPGRALSRRVNLCCVFPTPDGDAKRIHRGLSWFGQKKALCLAGRGEYLYFLAPKCLCRGYKP